MGMYTEIHFRAEIKPDIGVAEKNAIAAIMAGRNDVSPLPEHALFRTDRWDVLARGLSAYFETPQEPYFGPSGFGSHIVWAFSGSLKNYDSEIEKFFDWVSTIAAEVPGAFLGYSLYEESTDPTTYHMPEDR